MLTPQPVAVGRRVVLAGLLACMVSACVRPATRPAQRAPATTPEFDGWTQEASGILSDSLKTLRTYDTFHAFRVSTSVGSSLRQSSELAWDPPTGAAWDEATHVTHGLHGRTEQLSIAVTTATVDARLWREQRSVADATAELLALSDALTAYLSRVEQLPPGDASGALELLDKAWALWDVSAARWGMSRGEPASCGDT